MCWTNEDFISCKIHILVAFCPAEMGQDIPKMWIVRFLDKVLSVFSLLYIVDVKGLKETDTIRSYQEKLVEALLVHSLTHNPAAANKHCELLALISQLTRTCCIAKEQLTARQAAGDVPQFSLLSELLKGVMGSSESSLS